MKRPLHHRSSGPGITPRGELQNFSGIARHGRQHAGAAAPKRCSSLDVTDRVLRLARPCARTCRSARPIRRTARAQHPGRRYATLGREPDLLADERARTNCGAQVEGRASGHRRTIGARFCDAAPGRRQRSPAMGEGPRQRRPQRVDRLRERRPGGKSRLGLRNVRSRASIGLGPLASVATDRIFRTAAAPATPSIGTAVAPGPISTSRRAFKV